MTKLEQIEKKFDVIMFETFFDDDFVQQETIKIFYRQAITELIEELEEKINSLPSVFPEMESDDYDRGALRMKEEVLAIIKSYKPKK